MILKEKAVKLVKETLHLQETALIERCDAAILHKALFELTTTLSVSILEYEETVVTKVAQQYRNHGWDVVIDRYNPDNPWLEFS